MSGIGVISHQEANDRSNWVVTFRHRRTRRTTIVHIDGSMKKEDAAKAAYERLGLRGWMKEGIIKLSY